MQASIVHKNCPRYQLQHEWRRGGLVNTMQKNTTANTYFKAYLGKNVKAMDTGILVQYEYKFESVNVVAFSETTYGALKPHIKLHTITSLLFHHGAGLLDCIQRGQTQCNSRFILQ
mmetsp:Transcript_23669/g.65710  ORF Transcript_23669/g.65710 Transcript_23669/m.65710 type:complete len:116 (-) Transcript_23669:112-459(-)